MLRHPHPCKSAHEIRLPTSYVKHFHNLALIVPIRDLSPSITHTHNHMHVLNHSQLGHCGMSCAAAVSMATHTFSGKKKKKGKNKRNRCFPLILCS